MAHLFAAPLFSAKPSSPGDASLGELGHSLLRHWRWVAFPTLLAFVGSLVFVNVVSPRYTGEARLLLQSGESYFTRPGQDRAEIVQTIDEQAVASQVQVVMSRDLAREAIKRLGLVGNPEFDPGVRPPSLTHQLGMLIGLAGKPTPRAPEDRVLEGYYERLLVYPVGKSRIVSIEFRSKDAELAAKAANTVAGLYLVMQNDAKQDQARSASTWLGTNIDDLRSRVAAAEAKVEEFRARTGLLSAGGGTTTLSAQQLAELSTQLAQARSAQSDGLAKAQLIRDLVRDGRSFEIPDLANNELIRRLIEQRINLRGQLALELRTLLPQHPRIKELNAQLADLDGQVRGAAERTARTLENDTKIAGSRVASLETAINAQKTVVAQANESEVQLRALEREARAQRDQLESYLTRFREASARDSGNASPPDARVVSRAVVPEIPSFPKKLPIVALTTLAALMLSAGALVARELLRSPPAPARSGLGWSPYDGARPYEYGSRLQDGDVYAPAYSFDLAQLGRRSLPQAGSDPAANQPAAGTLPANAPALADEDAVADPRYEFTHLIERLRSSPVEERARRVLVSGIGNGPEATDLARSLATTLARGDRAILIEIDPDESAVSDVPGLTDLIAGEASFSDVIRIQPGSRLHRISVGTLKNEALTGGPEGLDVALSAFDKTYDWIVCASLASVEGELLRLFAPRVDAVVIASNLEPANQELVRAYEAAQAAGARDVMVAREQAPAQGSRAA